MKKQAKISNAVIKRLPRYRRYLKELRKKGVDKISSNEFSTLIGYTASQIRITSVDSDSKATDTVWTGFTMKSVRFWV